MRATLTRWAAALYDWLRRDDTSVPGTPQYRYWRQPNGWFYTLVAGNNEPLITTTQGYVSRAAVLRAIDQCRRNAATAMVVQTDRPVKE